MKNLTFSLTPSPSYQSPAQSPPAFPATQINNTQVTFSATFENGFDAINFSKFIMDAIQNFNSESADSEIEKYLRTK